MEPKAPTAAATARDDANVPSDGPERIEIVDVRTLSPGKSVFVSSSGREFVQTTSDSRVRVPDVPFDATLEAGALGGLFIASADLRRLRVFERDR